jgi:hypothetical protein
MKGMRLYDWYYLELPDLKTVEYKDDFTCLRPYGSSSAETSLPL